ncbi:hypothetical protein [Nonomuraea jabiensis]|uniref:hypothetical protein n=1 Tax=Nonomuraea jabiensis TaxID=882448 RepID=UPI003D70F478
MGGEHIAGVGGAHAGSMGVELDEQLHVGEGLGHQVSSAGDQRGLADPGHASTV